MKHPLFGDDYPEVAPEFAILQNSRTKETAIWAQGRWRVCPSEDYVPVALLSNVIRNAPDGVDLMKKVSNFLKKDIDS